VRWRRPAAPPYATYDLPELDVLGASLAVVEAGRERRSRPAPLRHVATLGAILDVGAAELPRLVTRPVRAGSTRDQGCSVRQGSTEPLESPCDEGAAALLSCRRRKSSV
jgi:hypothetical protein